MSNEKTTLELAATIAPLAGWDAETTVEAAQTFRGFIESHGGYSDSELTALRLAIDIAVKKWQIHPDSVSAEEMVSEAKKFLAYMDDERLRKNQFESSTPRNPETQPSPKKEGRSFRFEAKGRG